VRTSILHQIVKSKRKIKIDPFLGKRNRAPTNFRSKSTQFYRIQRKRAHKGCFLSFRPTQLFLPVKVSKDLLRNNGKTALFPHAMCFIPAPLMGHSEQFISFASSQA
jgi:hypothetical protein